MDLRDLQRKLAGPASLRIKSLIYRMENSLAPREFLDVADALRETPDSGASQLIEDGLVAQDLRKARTLQPFLRTILSENVVFFSADPQSPRAATDPAPDAATRGKRLLVCFCGRSGRMMLPLPVFLQRIDAAQFDVLLLKDSRQNHFRTGCIGLAPDFAGVAATIRHRYAARYAGMQSIGVSMGGLSAIRFAILAGCDRAVSICGMPADDVLRLHNPDGPPPAFDPLCDCMGRHAPPVLFVYPQGEPRDRFWARHYAWLTRGRTLRVRGVRHHGVMGAMWKGGQLDQLMALSLGMPGSGPPWHSRFSFWPFGILHRFRFQPATPRYTPLRKRQSGTALADADAAD